MDVNTELLIQHGSKVFLPAVEEGITWSTERKGCPGELRFRGVGDDVWSIAEGDAVRLRVNGSNVFYGFVFNLSRDKEQLITVTAYDQLRYLKNKDTYVYENKTAGELIKMIAADFQMQTQALKLHQELRKTHPFLI